MMRRNDWMHSTKRTLNFSIERITNNTSTRSWYANELKPRFDLTSKGNESPLQNSLHLSLVPISPLRLPSNSNSNRCNLKLTTQVDNRSLRSLQVDQPQRYDATILNVKSKLLLEWDNNYLSATMVELLLRFLRMVKWTVDSLLKLRTIELLIDSRMHHLRIYLLHKDLCLKRDRSRRSR